MKFKHILAVLSLVTLTLSVYPYSSVFSQNNPSVLNPQNQKINVTLPEKAKIILKSGASRSGQLTDWNATKKEITIELSGTSKVIAVKEIEKISFSGNYKLIHSGKLVIRGDDDKDNCRNTEDLTEPLTNVKIIESNDGKAEITLTSLKKTKLRGILDVTKNNSYRVDEITFNPSDKITLRVIACSE